MIFLDNAAGSWPKPTMVKNTILEALYKYGANPGRGSYRFSIDTSHMITDARIELAEFFGCPAHERFIFTAGATTSLNMALRGMLTHGDHVIFSGLEHNAVWRLLAFLENKGEITTTQVQANKSAQLTVQDFEQAINPQTKLITCLHASNVWGTVAPIRKIGAMAHHHSIPFLVDAAQSAGILPINAEKDNIDLLAVAGHKSLYGPAGIGGLYVGENINIEPLIFGGTGTLSEEWRQPSFYPDHLESGSLNASGIAGLLAGLSYIKNIGREEIYAKTMSLAKRFFAEAANIAQVEMYLPDPDAIEVPVISLNIQGIEPKLTAFYLDRDFDIAVRSGMHCTPLAHKAMDTLEEGTVRFSMGWFNTDEDIDKALIALNKIARNA
jgi:cysteine desulfurase family protein